MNKEELVITFLKWNNPAKERYCPQNYDNIWGRFSAEVTSYCTQTLAESDKFEINCAK